MHPIPSTMKSPRDQRPVWRGGVLQIWVTRACDLACTHCTQGSNLAGKPGMMTPDQFEEACKSLVGYHVVRPKVTVHAFMTPEKTTLIPTDVEKEHVRDIPPYFGVVGMFGGNPCVHPQFDELCAIMRKYIPFEQRGLWSNNLNGHGKTCRKTFNPDVSNLNVHQSEAAYEEMLTDWPLCQPKGLEDDSRHSPTMVAMQDMEDMTDEDRWGLLADCDVNQRWSALIGVFRGELRAWFCELAGAQAMLHENERDYPDTGKAVVPGWWNNGIEDFADQIRYHCFACGHPLRGQGDWAGSGTTEQVSKTHQSIYKLKKPHGKTIQLITRRDQLGGSVVAATQYLPGERGE